ncbi:MAG: DNA alkylation repair protein [Candidatus Paceibacterota bacterium]|jgi:3-methyladenine DNA glycosylase AlkD
MLIQIQKELRKVASKEKAKILARFFKTGKGEYGEGDKFLGVVVPEQRRIAKNVLAQESPLASILLNLQKLLQSEFHEERLIPLLILVELYKKGDPSTSSGRSSRKKIFDFYLKNLNRINNWDLVDLSSPNIIGDYILNYFTKLQARNFLLKLAHSKNLWSRRVAVLAAFPFIRNSQFEEILDLTRFLILDQKEKHDLMYKALGWMLREVGKRDVVVLHKFLRQYSNQLPRVTLRYAIERMSDVERKSYLSKPKSLAS